MKVDFKNKTIYINEYETVNITELITLIAEKGLEDFVLRTDKTICIPTCFPEYIPEIECTPSPAVTYTTNTNKWEC